MTTSVYVIAKHIETLLDDNKAALNLDAVYYRDQDKIPVGRAACVDPGDKSRELNGAPRRTQVDITVYIMVYFSLVVSQTAQAEAEDQAIDLIENKIHEDEDLNGLVISSLVTNIEYGFAFRSNTLFRVVRLTITARNQEQLPSSA